MECTRDIQLPERMTAYDALMCDAHAYVVVLNVDMKICDVSQSWCRFMSLERQDIIGKSLSDLLSAPVRQERLRLKEQVLRLRQPARITGMVKGNWMQTTYRPLLDAESQLTGLLVCATRPMFDDSDCDGIMNLRAHTHDLGALANLTRREFEILRLIAQGMAMSEIATWIYRSQKTVESHRRTLGQKLGAKNGPDLTRIATEAGLLWMSDDDFNGLLEVMHNEVDDKDHDASDLT